LLCYDLTSQKNLVSKFTYSEKATQFCEISTVDWSYEVMVKSTVEISQNFEAFLEYIKMKVPIFFDSKNRFKMKIKKKLGMFQVAMF
jgi:hypothetical protein